MTFTKEQLIEEVNHNLEHCFCSDKTKRLMEIALAALKAEPGLWEIVNPGEGTFYRPHPPRDFEEMERVWYAAPPAPASVPDAVELDDDFDSAFEHGKAVGWNNYRAAMLQGAEPAKTGLTLRESLAAIRNSGIAIDAEKIQAERDALNAPAIPDGYALVPVDMTPEMMRAVQRDSTLGTFASAHLKGAYDLYREFWEVACRNSPVIMDGSAKAELPAYAIKRFGQFSVTPHSEEIDGLATSIQWFHFERGTIPEKAYEQSIVEKYALQAIINALQHKCDGMDDAPIPVIWPAPQQEVK